VAKDLCNLPAASALPVELHGSFAAKDAAQDDKSSVFPQRDVHSSQT